jgi:ABC-type spermidine/putrescine transport system permease subunit I
MGMTPGLARDEDVGVRAAVRRLGGLIGERGQLVGFTIVWGVLVLVPMIGVVIMSFLEVRGMRVSWSLTAAAYQSIIESGRWQVLLRSGGMALFVTLVCLAAGFPFALWLAKRARSEWLKQGVWICLTVPFFLDPSARTLVWRAVLGATGVVNTALLDMGVVNGPVSWLLFSDFAVAFGLIPSYFPNMVWPIYLAVLLIDDDLLVASRDLGAAPLQTLNTIILPLAVPGIAAGVIFTFVPVVGDNVTTTLLGGGKKEYVADSVTSLVTTMNYAGAAAFSTVILSFAAFLVGVFWMIQQGWARFGAGNAAS